MTDLPTTDPATTPEGNPAFAGAPAGTNRPAVSVASPATTTDLAGFAPLDRPRSFDPDRLAFFSDAVMAIAITLLIIDLRIPDLGPSPTDAQLQAALRDLVPQFFAFVLSFAVIAVWWNAHHRLFGLLALGDRWILLANFVFLGAVVFLPFPTSILGRYSNLSTAVVLYAATNLLIALASFVMWWHAGRSRLFIAGYDEAVMRRRLAFMAIAPIVFGLSIPIAMTDPSTATISWNLIWILVLALGIARRIGDRARARRAPETPAD